MKFQKGSVRRSLKFSIWDGLFTAMMSGVSDLYLIPYAIALGATASQVAFLASFPGLIASFLQLKSAKLTQSIGSRIKLINFVVFFHAFSWIPIILIPYLLDSAANPSIKIWTLLGMVTLYASLGAFAVPAWQSLMSDTIPTKKRGKYFGWRNRLQGALSVLVSIVAGLILHAFGKESIAGFTIIFTFAFICRFCAWWCLTQMVEPFRHASHDVYFSFFDFLKRMGTSNFARFVLFVSLMSFFVNISAPLISVFLLKEIGYSYFTYMIVMMASAVAVFSFQSIWGLYGDLMGNIKVIKIAGWGVSFIPLFWMVSQHPVYLFFVQIVAGCFWGGFGLLMTNFLMEAVSPEKKIRCISYFNIMNSIAIVLGASLGGFLIHHVQPAFGYTFLTLFLISCAGRLLVMTFIAKKVHDVRRVELT